MPVREIEATPPSPDTGSVEHRTQCCVLNKNISILSENRKFNCFARPHFIWMILSWTNTSWRRETTPSLHLVANFVKRWRCRCFFNQMKAYTWEFLAVFPSKTVLSTQQLPWNCKQWIPYELGRLPQQFIIGYLFLNLFYVFADVAVPWVSLKLAGYDWPLMDQSRAGNF